MTFVEKFKQAIISVQSQRDSKKADASGPNRSVLRWANCYDGSRINCIGGHLGAIVCNDYLKILNEKNQYFSCYGQGIHIFATHPSANIFAYSENVPKPTLYLIQFPDFHIINKYTDEELLEYQAIEFSNLNFIATISGIPKFELIIWKQPDLHKVCIFNLQHEKPIMSLFNPNNQSLFAILYMNRLEIWNIDPSPKARTSKRVFKAPSPVKEHLEEWTELQEFMSYSTNDFIKSHLNLPKFTITNYLPHEFEKFKEDMRNENRLVFEAFTWFTDGYLVVASGTETYIKYKFEEPDYVILNIEVKDLFNKKTLQTPTMSPNHPKPESPVLDYVRSRSIVALKVDETPKKPTCIVFNKKNLIVGFSNGNLKYLEVTGINSYIELRVFVMQETITSLSLSSSLLFIGTMQGTLYTIAYARPETKPVEKFRCNTSRIMQIDVFFQHKTIFVTLKEIGLVEIWTGNGQLLSYLELDSRVEVTAMSSSKILNIVAIGTTSGLIYLALFNRKYPPRWLFPKKLHYQPVAMIKFFQFSPFFVVVYRDAKVFVMSGSAKKNFSPVAYIDLQEEGFEEVLHLSLSDDDKDALIALVVKNKMGGVGLVSYLFNSTTLKQRPDYLVSKNFKFNEETVKKFVNKIDEEIIGMASFGSKTIAFLCEDNTIKVFDIEGGKKEPEERQVDSFYKSDYELNVPKEKLSSAALFKNIETMQSDHRPVKLFEDSELNGSLMQSLNIGPYAMKGKAIENSLVKNWLVSSWQSGYIRVHDVKNGSLIWAQRCVNIWTGGVECFCLSADGSCVVYSASGIFCSSEVLPTKNGNLTQKNLHNLRKYTSKATQANKKEMRGEYIQMENMRTLINTYVKVPNRNAFQTQEHEEAIIKKIDVAIEKKVIYNPPMEEPTAESSWFDVQRLKQLAEDELVYGPIRYSIRSQVWKLREKLKELMRENDKSPYMEQLTFQELNLDLQQKKSIKDECEIEIATMKKEKEIENAKKKKLIERIKSLCWDSMEVKGREIEAFLTKYSVSNFPLKEQSQDDLRRLRVVRAHRRIEIADQQLRLQMGDHFTRSKKSKGSMKSIEVDNDELFADEKSNESLYGSYGNQVEGGSEFFYAQFEISTKWQKINQIYMLQDAIYRIKKEFNKEFDELMKKKIKEIQLINKRNKRIRTIMADLEMNVSEIVNPVLSSFEQPELLFTTNDDEPMNFQRTRSFIDKLRDHVVKSAVKSKKMLDMDHKQEVKLQEEERVVEADNWRERGLELMMGGMLEIKKEDELKKEIPIPAFMNEKTEEKWTEEERKAAAEYKTQLKTQEEEREKYKKFLEVELRKLQSTNTESMQKFDEMLFEFYHRKIIVQSAVYQEELKIARYTYSMLLEEMLDKKEVYLRELLEVIKEDLNVATTILNQAKNKHESFQSMYDIHVEEDRMHDKFFKKKFIEIPQLMLDILYRMYKKRPRVMKSRQLDRSREGQTSEEDPMQDLDHIRNMPEGLSQNQWQQFCSYRHEKMAKEIFLKSKLETLLELQKEHQYEQKRVDAAKQNLDEVYNSINQAVNYRYQYHRNVEIQLLMKQGQVEVDQTFGVYNFKNCLLIHRDVIEDLNKNIKIIGENKIATMIESKDFKKGIAQLEWEHRKMEMELQDLKSKMKDIDNFKVTKEVLFFLKRDNYDEMKNQEIMTLEKTLAMAKKYHEKNIKNREGRIEDLQKSITSLKNNNEKLQNELKKLNSSILVRKKLHDVVVDKSGMAKVEMEKRHKMIVEKSKLLKVKHTQAEEIASLKEQLKMLQRKTFPSLELDDNMSKKLSCVRKKFPSVSCKKDECCKKGWMFT